MATQDLVQRRPAVLIFSLIFAFLPGTTIASENSAGRIPFLISSKERALSPYERNQLPLQAGPNRGYVSNLRYGQQEDASSVETSGSLAEVYLGRLADKYEIADKFYPWILAMGTGFIAFGAAIAVADVVTTEDIEDAGTMSSFCVVYGHFSMALASHYFALQVVRSGSLTTCQVSQTLLKGNVLAGRL